MRIELTKKIEQRLRALGVVALYLFGSRAQDRAGVLSDFDFAVLMDTIGHKRGDGTYDALYDLLAPLCHRTLQNDVIDIVFLNDAPLELRMHVLRYGRLLFDPSPRIRLRFEERTTLEYCDFRPLLNVTDQAILASL